MDQKQYKYWLVIQQVYAQQQDMYEQKKHHVEHRIVSVSYTHLDVYKRQVLDRNDDNLCRKK